MGIGLFILLYTAISTFVYFELKNLLVVFDSETRVQIWAGMDFAVNTLAIGTAMFGTGRIATRFGLAVTLALVPVVIVAGLLVVARAPMIGVVVGIAGTAENVGKEVIAEIEESGQTEKNEKRRVIRLRRAWSDSIFQLVNPMV